MQDHPADQLDVEVPHPEHALAAFADHGERLGQQVVERLAGLEPPAKLVPFGHERGVVERLDLGLEHVDPVDDRLQLLEQPLVLRPDDLRE